MEMDVRNMPTLSRRQVLTALSIPAASLIATGSRASSLSALNDVCFMTPQSIEGPYYLDPLLVRANIGEDRQGVPLRVNLRLIDGATCKPSERARVDLWHADARGVYSGYPGQGDKEDVSTTGQKFLRGTQFTDSEGSVTFETIYPGWYVGRATHIHFKVLIDDRNILTGQMYFPDAVNEFIYTNVALYAGRLSSRDIVNANDSFANFHDPRRLAFASIKEERDCYVASLVLGVDRSAVANAERPPRESREPAAPKVERVRLLVPGFK